ncbi:hypothetical protein K501DRAFT_289590 [Backusella circina FSU 941]|nr:hypothetical protein K501DRAFT_289590 [Backusella circina FSU 941]
MDKYQSEIPDHLPVDMAIAPDTRPYEHTHLHHARQRQEEGQTNKLAQHSLSPEKLGVVGYVKDVAGFVKDAVQGRREQKRLQRRSSASSTEEASQRTEHNVRRKSSAEHITTTAATTGSTKNERTPFAEAVTGLFPGVGENGPGCTHADELRNQMKHINDEHSNKLL